jgi:hypothetical protein
LLKLSLAEPMTTDEMPYIDGEKETDAAAVSKRLPGHYMHGVRE